MISFRSALLIGTLGTVLGGCVNTATSVVRATPSNSVSQPSNSASQVNAAIASSPGSSQTSVASCSSLGSLGSAYDTAIPATSIDQALFGEAILHYTNERRCASGLNPLRADSGLTTAATGHSQDMARLNFFGHDSPVPGKGKFHDRMRQAGVSFTAAAENLGRNSLLSLDSGRQFYVIDRASCQFTYQQGGAPIAPHTYRSLAQEFVTSWINSPGHRANLLGSQYTRLGSGGALKANAANCGDIVATQKFAA